MAFGVVLVNVHPSRRKQSKPHFMSMEMWAVEEGRMRFFLSTVTWQPSVGFPIITVYHGNPNHRLACGERSPCSGLFMDSNPHGIQLKSRIDGVESLTS